MKKFAFLVPAFVLAVSAPLAQAALSISYEIGGSNPATAISCGAATGLCLSETGSGVTLSFITLTSNSPGSGGIAQEFGGTTTIQNTGTTAQTIALWFSSTGFTAPTTPPNISYSSEIGITATTGTGSAVLESCVDTANQVAPSTGTFCKTPAASLTNATVNSSGGSSANNTVSELISSLTITPYSLEQEIVITLNGGSTMNLSTSEILSSVPEPTSVVLLGSLIFGLGLVFRRKLSRSGGTVA